MHSGDSACSLPPFSLRPETDRRAQAPDRGHGARAERPWPDERAVRHRGAAVGPAAHLRAGGQSARQPHGALRRQDHRHAAGGHRRQGHGRRDRWRVSALPKRPTTTWRSRRRCFPSPASPASTRCWARRCAPPARSWAWTGDGRGEPRCRPSPAPSPRASWPAAPCCPPPGAVFVSVKDARQAVDRRAGALLLERGFRILATGGTAPLPDAGGPRRRRR